MKVPDVVRVQVRSAEPTDLSGLIVHMKVRAGRKNPYFILFPKTDASGRATMTRTDFIGQFTDHWESGLMDYDGRIEDASSTVEVSLFDATWSRENRHLAMAWPLLTHESSRWTSREQEYQYRVSCRNHLFSVRPQSVDLVTSPSFQLEVSPTEDGAV